MTEANAPIIYVDANPFIYFVDGDSQAAERVRPFFELIAERPGIAATSELTLAEVLAKAPRHARRNYLGLIVWSKFFQLLEVTRDILIETADYRSVSQRSRPDGTKATLKLPDAIHVVTAIKSRCRLFLSADEGLVLPENIALIPPNDTGFAQASKAVI